MGRPIKYTIEDLENTIKLFSSPIKGVKEEDRKKSLWYYRERLRVRKGDPRKISAAPCPKKNTEDDNEGKHGSRDYITTIINDHFNSNGDKRIALRMFDFLGGGVGAQHYMKNIKGLGTMCLLDSNKQKINKFLREDYKRLIKEYYRPIEVYHLDATDYLVNVNPTPFDILNLDFCAYFYENGTPNSTRGIIETAFKTGAVKRDGLLLCTFQIKGYGVNMQKNRQKIDTDPKVICEKIRAIAEKYAYTIEEEITYEYKSSVSSVMLNVAFRLGE